MDKAQSNSAVTNNGTSAFLIALDTINKLQSIKVIKTINKWTLLNNVFNVLCTDSPTA